LRGILKLTVKDKTIDISWVDYPYTASTCDVMYCRQRRHYGGKNLKYYVTPPPQFSLIDMRRLKIPRPFYL
jgi:hypothetical protein